MEHMDEALSADAALVLRKMEFIGASAAQIAEVLADSDRITRMATAWRMAAE
jgi:hypothetical protein